MKKSLKKRLVTGIALLLTATILLISGGSVIVVSIIGGTGFCFLPRVFHLNDVKQKANNTKYAQTLTHNDSQPIIDENEIYFAINKKNEYQNNESLPTNIKDEDIPEVNLLYKLETIDAFSQQEKVNRLVRKRKKEPTGRIRKNNL